MTRRIDAPPEARVRARLDELRERAGDNGTQPGVLALASKFGMSNTIFRHHFPDIAQEIAALRSARPTPGTPSEPTRNARLKRRNRELTETLTLAACHIQ